MQYCIRLWNQPEQTIYRPIANILVKKTTGLEGVRENIVDDFSELDYLNILMV
jgi:hypothetical protein